MSEKSEENGGVLERVVHGGETFTTVEEYADELGYPSEEGFIRELGDGKVLDLGSGLGGLAKSAAFKQLPCIVYSLNPRGGKGQRRDEKEATRDYVLGELTRQRSQKDRLEGIKDSFQAKKIQEGMIRRVQEAHDKYLVRALAHRLPFEDGLFNLIIDNQAMSKYAGRPDDNYASNEERMRFKQAMMELFRVLRPGGKIRIGDSDYGYGEEDSQPISWKEQVLTELGFNYRLILIIPKTPVPPFLLRRDGRMTMGVEIFKAVSDT